MNTTIEDQPPPQPGGVAIWPLVVQDMQQRDQLGRQRYGTPLQAHNGRDALVDAYQEALDLAVYMRQRIEEDRWMPLEDAAPERMAFVLATIEWQDGSLSVRQIQWLGDGHALLNEEDPGDFGADLVEYRNARVLAWRAMPAPCTPPERVPCTPPEPALSSSAGQQIVIYRAIVEDGVGRVQDLTLFLLLGLWLCLPTCETFAREGALDAALKEGGWSRTRADALRAGIARVHEQVFNLSRGAGVLAEMLAEEQAP